MIDQYLSLVLYVLLRCDLVAVSTRSCIALRLNMQDPRCCHRWEGGQSPAESDSTSQSSVSDGQAYFTR